MKVFLLLNEEVFWHKHFENRSVNGREMTGFLKTLNLIKICQINVLP